MLFAMALVEPILRNLLSGDEEVDYTYVSVFAGILFMEAFFRGKQQATYNHLGIRFSKAVATTVTHKLMRLRCTTLNE